MNNIKNSKEWKNVEIKVNSYLKKQKNEIDMQNKKIEALIDIINNINNSDSDSNNKLENNKNIYIHPFILLLLVLLIIFMALYIYYK
jgi:hypothetical protein